LTEEAHTDLMRLYASAGRPSEVRRQLHELERLFTAELGANPSEATYNLAHRLRAEAELVAPSADCHHETPGPIASHPPVKTPARTPYGRFVAALGIALLVISLAIWSVSRSPLTKGLPAAKRVKAVTPHGHLFWRKRYAPKRGDRDSAPVAIVTDKRGYFVVGGFVQTLKTDVDMLVAKYDPYGARLWEYRYDGDGHDLDRLKAMAVGPDGAVYAACESMGKTGCENERLSELDMVVIKLDSYGNKIWDHRYRGKSNGLDSPADIGIDTAGNVYVAGRSWQAHAASHGLVVLKYSPSGKRLWEYQSPHEGRDERAVNMVVRDHAVYVAAHSASISSSPGDSDLFLKLSAEGKQEWRQAFSGVSSGSLTSPRVAVDKDDAVYLAVESAPDTSHGAIRKSKIVLTKFSPDKTEVWRKELPARTDDADVTTDLNADPRGGVVFTGLRRGQVAYILCGSYSSAGVIRYLHKIYTDPGESKAPSMSVDRDGNVAVTGSIFTGIGSTGHSYDAITAFIRADGEMLWRDWYDGPDHERDMGMAVTTQEGKIYVAVQATEGGISEVQIFRYSPFPEKLSGR
jgi:outer membrane protein assembly factor BamB